MLTPLGGTMQTTLKPAVKLTILAALLSSAHAHAQQIQSSTSTAVSNVYSTYAVGGVGGYQPPAVNIPQSSGRGVYIDRFLLKFDFGVNIGHDSNVNLTNGPGKVSSNFVMYTPRATLSRNFGTSRLDAYYTGHYMRYGGASSFDYNDSDVGLNAAKEWTSRLKTTLRLDYTLGHDNANAYVLTSQPQVERWKSPLVQAVVHYGTDGAKGQVEVEADYRQQRYTTDQAIMRQYDLNETRLIGRFYYRIRPKTQMVFALANQRDVYPTPAAGINSNATQQRATVGVKWEATAKTTGQVNVGLMHMKMDAGGSGNTGLAWDAGVRWAPRTYSVFNLDGSRQYNEWSNNTVAYEVSQGAVLSWDYGWTPRITSTASLLGYDDNFLGSGRRDKRYGAGLKVSYALGRRYHIGLEDIVQKRTSNSSQWNFNENITMLTLDAAL